MDHFKVGDTVKWESQSGGVARKKEGVIVAMVPKEVFPTEKFIQQSAGITEYIPKGDFGTYWKGYPRNNVSFLVRVDGKSDKDIPRIYWPRTRWLKKIEEGE